MMDRSARPGVRVVETDVLVVGGGGAGALAGIAAAKAGASVVVAVKGKLGRSGATPTAGADFMADARSVVDVLGYAEGDRTDSRYEFMLDIVQEGKYLSNQQLVELYVEDAPYRIKELIEWGMKPTHIENAHGSRFPRGVMAAGPDIGRALRNGAKRYQVPLMEDVLVTDLLTHGGRIAGAAGIDQRTGAPIVFKSGAVVLGTGGWQVAYPWTSATEDLTGDGQAMAYRAGADLMDMEMVQFLPGIVINPPAWRRSIFLYAFPAGILLNKYGEQFLRRWDAMMVDAPMVHWPKEAAAIAIKVEVLEGRGSPAGGVYFSLKHLPDNLIEDLMTHASIGHWKADRLDTRAMLAYLRSGKAIEVTGDAAHFTTGGIRIDRNCATTLPGLYAAGECTAGTWGAERVCSAVTEMVVQGHVAGAQAAAFVAGAGKVEPAADAIEATIEALFAPLERLEGPRPVIVRQQLQKTAGDKVGVVRTGKMLADAVRELADMRPLVDGLATTSKTPRYNREWFEALQLRNLVEVVDISAQAALARTESRGGHFRRDCPITDNDNWLVNLVARKGEEGVELSRSPVVVTQIPLPSGQLPFLESSRR